MNILNENAVEYTLKVNKKEFKNSIIKSSKESADYIRQFYGDDLEIFESFFILLLNNRNETIGYSKISQGGIVGTIVDVRIICKYAIESLATSVIIAHNHPSGNKKESSADIQITQKIKNALNILDIKLLDHIILTSDSYTSFSDEGLM